MFSLEWAERKLRPFVNRDTGKFILFLDNLSTHVHSDFRDTVKALRGLAWFCEPGATDIWQPVDGGYASTLKVLIRNEFSNWLNDDEIMKKWYGKDSHITASEKGILVTHWVGDAYLKLTSSKHDSIHWRMFEKTGCFVTANGSEDKKIQPEGLPNYTVSPPIALDHDTTLASTPAPPEALE